MSGQAKNIYTSNTKWGSLAFGKKAEIADNNESVFSSTPKENSDTDVTKDSDLTLNCSLAENIQKNKVNENTVSPLKNSSFRSVASNSSRKESCKQFFVPPEIFQIFADVTQSNNTKSKNTEAKEIVDYYFDSCLSDEEDSGSSEIKLSNLDSDLDLYSFIARLKKRTETRWQIKSKVYTKRTSKCPSRVQIDQGIELPTNHLEKSSVDKSLTVNSLKLTEDNSIDATLNNVEVSEAQVLPLNVEENLKIGNCLNFGGSVSKDLLFCDNTNNNSSVDDLFSQEYNESKNNSDIDKHSSICVQNSVKNKGDCDVNTVSPFSDNLKNCVVKENKEDSISLSDTEIELEDWNKDEMKKFKERSKVETVKGKTDSKLKERAVSRHAEENSTDSELSLAGLSGTPKRPNEIKTSSDHIKNINRTISTINEDNKFSSFKSRKENKKSNSSSIVCDDDKPSVRYKSESEDYAGVRDSVSDNSNAFVIKLSSDSEHDSDSSNNPATIKKVNRHVSVSSDSSHSDSERQHSISHQENYSIGKTGIEFDDDFLRKNEVWLIQCPKNMNVRHIKGQSLNIPKRTVVHDHGSKYECYAHQTDNTHQSVNIALPCANNRISLNVVPVAGNVVFEEKIDVPAITSITVNAKRKVSLPDGLKVRHPLLGLDYQDQPKTSVVDDSDKRKRKRNSSSSVNRTEDDQLHVEKSSPKKKKKKKKKHKKDCIE